MSISARSFSISLWIFCSLKNEHRTVRNLEESRELGLLSSPQRRTCHQHSTQSPTSRLEVRTADSSQEHEETGRLPVPRTAADSTGGQYRGQRGFHRSRVSTADTGPAPSPTPRDLSFQETTSKSGSELDPASTLLLSTHAPPPLSITSLPISERAGYLWGYSVVSGPCVLHTQMRCWPHSPRTKELGSFTRSVAAGFASFCSNGTGFKGGGRREQRLAPS